jgi:hypothetical protein
MDDYPLPLTPAAQIVAGLLVLILGRRLFWVFVGVVGFFCGLQFGMKLFAGMSDGLLLLLSIVVGIACGGLAIMLQRLAVAIAGAFAGALLALRLAPIAGLHNEAGLWVATIAGALLAAVLLSALFDPALIFLSAVTGALMIGEALTADPLLEPLVIGVLFIIGVVVQIRLGTRVNDRTA